MGKFGPFSCFHGLLSEIAAGHQIPIGKEKTSLFSFGIAIGWKSFPVYCDLISLMTGNIYVFGEFSRNPPRLVEWIALFICRNVLSTFFGYLSDERAFAIRLRSFNRSCIFKHTTFP